ncbi:hypothetical protein CNEO2_860017 [Clostridium neonatale]|nr:hypothetical protein CNEO_10021 [Clostridium neonatale]CAI3215568.1 hypothetical protein CNEO2_860017 [Clostridium neonatale]CAI3606569.1 hypothetical protein CNEO4_1370001 [Clostridium neonatale]
MFDYLDTKNMLFLMRVPSSFKTVQNIDSNDCILEYKIKRKYRKLRVIKIELSNNITEILVTNIFDENIKYDEFKELYFLRWGVESKYKELKSSIQIEEFSGTKPISIEQDFFVSIYLSMVVALIKDEADAAIADEIKDKNLKSMYQANRNFILGQVFNRIINLLVNAKLTRKI